MRPVLEQIGFGVEQSISAFEYCRQDFVTPWHFHPVHELTFIDASSGTKFIGDYVGPYEEGDLVMIHANLPHCWKNQKRQNGLSRSIVIWWEERLFQKIPELASVRSLINHSKRGIQFKSQDLSEIVSKIRTLSTARGSRLFYQLLEILIALTEADYTMLSSGAQVGYGLQTHSSRMQAIHDYLEINYQQKIYLSDLAQLLSMSEQSFSRYFSKVMGRPFFSFLNEYRINIASRLLLDSDYSISSIAYACGYDSLPHFHRQFVKFKGKPPARFRKICR